jgi:TRAP-type C4-dicarboxylate transport system permease small subunit
VKVTTREAPRRTDYVVARLLTSLESVAVVGLTLALLVTSAIQVTTRYILDSPVTWTEETSIITLVWLAFIGAALVSGTSDHVTMRIGGKRLGRRGRVVLAVVSHLVVMASSLAVINMGYDATKAKMALDLPATGWPAGLSYLGALVGLGLIAVHSVLNAWVIVRGGYDEAAEDVEEGIL